MRQTRRGGATVVSGGAGGVPALGITSPSAVATPLDATTPAAKTPMATFFPTRVASSSLSSLVSSLARVTARPRPDLDDVDVVLRIVVARVAATRGAFVRADMTNETFPRAFVRRSRARERRVGVWRWIKRDTALYLGDARERARRGRAVSWRRDTCCALVSGGKDGALAAMTIDARDDAEVVCFANLCPLDATAEELIALFSDGGARVRRRAGRVRGETGVSSTNSRSVEEIGAGVRRGGGWGRGGGFTRALRAGRAPSPG